MALEVTLLSARSSDSSLLLFPIYGSPLLRHDLLRSIVILGKFTLLQLHLSFSKANTVLAPSQRLLPYSPVFSSYVPLYFVTLSVRYLRHLSPLKQKACATVQPIRPQILKTGTQKTQFIPNSTQNFKKSAKICKKQKKLLTFLYDSDIMY